MSFGGLKMFEADLISGKGFRMFQGIFEAHAENREWLAGDRTYSPEQNAMRPMLMTSDWGQFSRRVAGTGRPDDMDDSHGRKM